MRATGWDTATLRRQPARVVRAHFVRIFAGLVWSPELAQSAASPLPSRSAYSDLTDYAAARRAKAEINTTLERLERLLWPEDE